MSEPASGQCAIDRPFDRVCLPQQSHVPLLDMMHIERLSREKKNRVKNSYICLRENNLRTHPHIPHTHALTRTHAHRSTHTHAQTQHTLSLEWQQEQAHRVDDLLGGVMRKHSCEKGQYQ